MIPAEGKGRATVRNEKKRGNSPDYEASPPPAKYQAPFGDVEYFFLYSGSKLSQKIDAIIS